MAEIAVLDKQTIDKIAAGEVVERPASVVKELVENAVDAKATAITVEIREGGISLMRITDNGCGIENSQVATAFFAPCDKQNPKCQRFAYDWLSGLSRGGAFEHFRSGTGGDYYKDAGGTDRNPLCD